MSDRYSRRGVPANWRDKRRPPHPSPSPSPASRRRRSSRQFHGPQSSNKPSRTAAIFKRCNSEPALWRAAGGAGDNFGQRSLNPPETEGVLYRPHTCADIFSASSENILLLPRSPQRFLEGYKKDAKVVVNVTVEGSPGPVRAMVKLGSSVEETIKLVIDKYGEEGRTPRLDTESASTFELHHSYFSLQSLNKSDAIGESGSRCFYLRKSSNASFTPDTLSDSAGAQMPGSAVICLQSFIFRKIKKFIRRTHKLWKLMGCINCNR